jgi:hypothetical protein
MIYSVLIYRMRYQIYLDDLQSSETFIDKK